MKTYVVFFFMMDDFMVDGNMVVRNVTKFNGANSSHESGQNL